MKSSLWKILLVLTAIILGAALLVPKALRDKTEKGAEPITATELSVTNIGVVTSVALIFHGVTDAKPNVVELPISYLSEGFFSGRGQVSGGFTLKEAKDLVRALNAGTTPAKQRPVD